MAVITEGQTIGDLLAYEQDKNYCREVVTITDDDITIGDILAQKSSDESWNLVALTETTSGDKTATAKCVVISEPETRNNVMTVVVLARNGIVKEDGLIYPANATATQKKAIKANLKSEGILVRESF